MFYVYFLRSVNNGRIYTGFTKDLEERLHKHKNKGGYTTRRMGKIELIFYEAFKVEKDATRRERYFKTTKGKKALKLILRESLKM